MFGIHAIKDARSIARTDLDSRRRASGGRTRRGWSVEALEGRALLSVYVVNSPGDAGQGSGFTGDLRYAIERADQSPADSTIVFNPSVYGPGITLSSGMLTIDKPSGTLTIQGPGASRLSISGGQLTQVLDIAASSNVTISGLTITGGAWPLGPGGGILNDGQLTLSRCTITGNTDFGDGGGGIANQSGGTMTIFGSTISGNVATGSDGGGIANAGSMTIVQSTISGNGSRGGNAGGITNTGTLTISDSTISGNRATIYQGGGIVNAGALTLTDDTISNNTANLAGGGILNQAIQNGTITMDNTIVADNVALIEAGTADVLDNGDPYGTFLIGSNNLVGVGDTEAMVRTLVGVDPQLGPLQDNGGPTWTQAITIGSPAAGAGNPALDPAGMASDQRGLPYARIVVGQLDIGAFEIQLTRRVVPSPSKTPTPVVPIVHIIIGLTIDPTSKSHGSTP